MQRSKKQEIHLMTFSWYIKLGLLVFNLLLHFRSALRRIRDPTNNIPYLEFFPDFNLALQNFPDPINERV